ncbi:hypothetical protein VPFG_00257 [Vibrio phage nt-1]|uniref:Uncharacterized protein n=1 Tax=Vibrio phage nt-1 TaxID=115992 RepID=R9TEQ0_9CAUD|nr:hypothetical protein VPFG_00257 [Vibrio phage nt-1]AGN30256.1 hypothetical protein VPFG_00257 [Vibrio phage nt-1]
MTLDQIGFIIYGVVAVLVVIGFVIHEVVTNKDNDTPSEFGIQTICIALIWPVISILIIVVGGALAIETITTKLMNKLKGR